MANKVPRVSKPIYKPFQVDLTDDQKLAVEQWLSNRVEQAIAGLSEYHTNIETWRKSYDGDQYTRDLPFENASNIRIPLTGVMVDVIHTRLVQSHFGVEPFIRIKPLETADVVVMPEEARSYEEIVKYENSLSNLQLEGFHIIKDALITGVGISKTTWFQDWKLVSTGKKKKYVLRSAYAKTEHIPTEDFLIYPARSADIDSATLVGHRMWKRWDELQRGIGLGLYNEDWIETLRQRSTTRPSSESSERLGITDTPVDWTDMDYETFECIIAYDLDEDGLAEDYLVTYNRDTRSIIRFINYPAGWGERWYETYCPIPVTDSIYGDSMVRLIMDMDEGITTLYNQRIDNNTIVNIPQYTAVEGSPAAQDKEKAFPGKKWLVNDHDDIRPFNQPTPMRDTVREEEKLLVYLQFRAGTNELNLGKTPQGEKTAYEIEAALAEGSVALRLKIQFGMQWLKRIAWHTLALCKQFMDIDVYERVTGYPFLLADKEWEDLWQEIGIEPVGNSTTSNRELERQKMVFLRESMKNDPLVFKVNPATGQPEPQPGWYEIDKQFILAHGYDNYTSFIGTAPTAEPVVAPAQAMGTMANQPGLDKIAESLQAVQSAAPTQLTPPGGTV